MSRSNGGTGRTTADRPDGMTAAPGGEPMDEAVQVWCQEGNPNYDREARPR